MSYLFYSLEQFGFTSLEEVTASRLKRAFKKQVIIQHPDKGGDESSFDALLNSYLYLCETIDRLNGGRSTLQSINAPDELREQRANQFINELFDELNLEQDDTSKTLPDDFHEQFAGTHVNEHANGYDAWLKNNDGFVVTEQYDHLTIKKVVEDNTFHSTFEEQVRIGKPTPTTLALHLNEMAYSANTGTTLIKSGTFTSAPGLRPEYTDLYSAYTTENTMFDKLVPIKERTYEELLKEREEAYTVATDEDATVIAAYARKKIDDEIEHKRALESYFKNGAFIENGVSNKVIISDDEKKDGFMICL